MTQTLDAALQAFHPALPLGVAFSGGADSTALLVRCAEQWPQQVVALHINHGLQAAASDFESHCRSLCERLAVPLRVLSVAAQHARGQSPEDAARTARYQGLVQLATAAEYTPLASLALAQHADDQVETLLLALSRGAGMAGLSAMPAQWQRDGLSFYRPLLRVAGAELRDWLLQRGMGWVEDPSNASLRYTRNRIRAQVLPALEAAFPQFRTTFVRSAGHAAQAQALLEEMAAQDLAQAGCIDDGSPLLAGLQLLSPLRLGNALRHWLKLRHRVIPSSMQLQELVSQVQAARTRGQRIHIRVGAGFAVRRGKALTWVDPDTVADALPAGGYNRRVLHQK